MDTLPPSFVVELINGHSVPCRFLHDAGTQWWIERLENRPSIKIDPIGKSRGGRVVYGITAGTGPVHVSITAGAHADEPAGPMAACALAWLLSDADCGPLRDRFTFRICAQVNPDGAEANKQWFAETPDIETYLRHVKREGPGDDIEFGYSGGGKDALRPENHAVAEFLSTGATYYSYHASLHSMGMAEGAWYLIEKSWAERTFPLQQRLIEIATRQGFGLHDIQRNGDKGFTRIRRGFCTTPTSVAMRDYFLQENDSETADKFHLSSMEFVKSLGGDPLAMVSEIPNFVITGQQSPSNAQFNADRHSSDEAPSPGETLYERCRDRIKERMIAGDVDGAVEAVREAGVVPVPFAKHVALQVEMVLAGVEFIIADTLPRIVNGVLSDDSSGPGSAGNFSEK